MSISPLQLPLPPPLPSPPLPSPPLPPPPLPPPPARSNKRKKDSTKNSPQVNPTKKGKGIVEGIVDNNTFGKDPKERKQDLINIFFAKLTQIPDIATIVAKMQTILTLNNPKEQFEIFNIVHNNIDAQHDGTNAPTLIGLNVFQYNGGPITLDELEKLINGLKNKLIELGYIIPLNMTRKEKGDKAIINNAPWATQTFMIGLDSGLGPENFIKESNFHTLQSIARQLDASPHVGNKPFDFPNIGIPLEIMEEYFKSFGYIGCSLEEAIKQTNGPYQYHYKLNIGSSFGAVELTHLNNTKTANSNAAKKQTNASGNPRQKIAKIKAKGLGDKLQAMILFCYMMIYAKVGESIAQATCDRFLFLLCVLLQMGCFYTNISKTKEGVKMNDVFYYDESNATSEAAIKRFKSAAQELLDDYGTLIAHAEYLATTHDNGVTISGLETQYFDKEVYLAIRDDLVAILGNITQIYDALNALIPLEPLSIPQINQCTQLLQNLTPNMFLKRNQAGQFIFMHGASKYTRADFPTLIGTWPEPIRQHLHNMQLNNNKRSLTALVGNDVSRATFYAIAKDYTSKKRKAQVIDVLSLNPQSRRTRIAAGGAAAVEEAERLYYGGANVADFFDELKYKFYVDGRTEITLSLRDQILKSIDNILNPWRHANAEQLEYLKRQLVENKKERNAFYKQFYPLQKLAIQKAHLLISRIDPMGNQRKTIILKSILKILKNILAIQKDIDTFQSQINALLITNIDVYSELLSFFVRNPVYDEESIRDEVFKIIDEMGNAIVSMPVEIPLPLVSKSASRSRTKNGSTKKLKKSKLVTFVQGRGAGAAAAAAAVQVPAHVLGGRKTRKIRSVTKK